MIPRLLAPYYMNVAVNYTKHPEYEIPLRRITIPSIALRPRYISVDEFYMIDAARRENFREKMRRVFPLEVLSRTNNKKLTAFYRYTVGLRES